MAIDENSRHLNAHGTNQQAPSPLPRQIFVAMKQPRAMATLPSTFSSQFLATHERAIFKGTKRPRSPSRENILNLGRSGNYNLRSTSPQKPTTKTLVGRYVGASNCYPALPWCLFESPPATSQSEFDWAIIPVHSRTAALVGPVDHPVLFCNRRIEVLLVWFYPNTTDVQAVSVPACRDVHVGRV